MITVGNTPTPTGLPPSVAPFVSVIAQVGVILFMFLVGLELDTSRLRKRTQATIAISHASIIVPFIMGSTLAIWLYPILSSSDVPFTTFALFLGVSLSVTAFPVLARILTDRGIHRTPLGVIALTCAAVDDVTAWCLLAFIVGIVNAQASNAVITLGLSGVYERLAPEAHYFTRSKHPWVTLPPGLPAFEELGDPGKASARSRIVAALARSASGVTSAHA